MWYIVPGVYSRTSAMFPWLREIICKKSNAAPSYLFCNTINVPIAVVPSPAPPSSSSSGVLTFYIKTDTSPEDTGWELRSVPGNKIFASRPMGYYTKQQTEIFEKVVVEPESFYRLIIYDRDKDGFQGIMSVYKGESTAKADLLVLEPGFSSKSRDSVSHGLYVGDSPPNVLTLDIKFDSNPDQLAWILTNQEDNLQLGFRWFGFYTKSFESVRETIPIYGSERGLQEYKLMMYDNNGDGLCCASGMGSYALYLGGSADANNQIISGAQYLKDESYVFKISSSGELVFSSNPSPLGTWAANPAPAPTMAATNPVPDNNDYAGYNNGYSDASFPTINSGSSGTTLDNRGPSSALFSYLLFTTLAMIIFLFR